MPFRLLLLLETKRLARFGAIEIVVVYVLSVRVLIIDELALAPY